MSGQSLCIRTFAEVIRGRMNKKAQIKNFDTEKKLFQSDAEAKRKNNEIDLSQVYAFYKLLLDAVVYIALGNGEEGIPDINPSMTSQLKNGEWEINQKIKEIAQRKEAKKIISGYFEANLIPNIPNSVRPSVLDDIDTLVRDSSDIKRRKRDSLKQAYQQRKSDALYLAEVYLLALCNGTNKKDDNQSQPKTAAKKKKSDDPFEKLDTIDALIRDLPAPKKIDPPAQPLKEEQPYISELYAAYGDKEGIADFCESHLAQFDEYQEDRNERRIDYFAADSIRRGVSELYSGKYANQFNVLKDETFAGVNNTARKSFPNGYERMLNVMEQAVIIQVNQYILSRSPHWISNRIKKGVCHFLVNDNKLKWVKR
ncbi:ABC-three component system protein [Paradesulfitobacterium ferrireducens]|uniref:ABC-three component system protein n=1 Tax=Paradesulfitobacterium ferrireducens TaxID=2816476 RepID=UPI001A8DF341|nr:ABC-three component system protein [Paradesulfitobacterium ferrireducens]